MTGVRWIGKWGAVLTSAALTAMFAVGRSESAPGAIYPTAAFTFDDTTTGGSHAYDLWSDGLDGGRYASGKDGLGGTIDAEFTVDGQPSNVNLNLIKSKRRFNGMYTSLGCAAIPNCTPLPAGSGTFGDGWFLTIWKIPDMANGETRLAQAQFTYGGTQRRTPYPRFSFFWCNGAETLPSWRCSTVPANGSGTVLATRNDAAGVATWTVSAVDEPSNPGGDVSEAFEQTDQSTSISRGLYRTRLRVTIQCLKGCQGLRHPPS